MPARMVSPPVVVQLARGRLVLPDTLAGSISGVQFFLKQKSGHKKGRQPWGMSQRREEGTCQAGFLKLHPRPAVCRPPRLPPL